MDSPVSENDSLHIQEGDKKIEHHQATISSILSTTSTNTNAIQVMALFAKLQGVNVNQEQLSRTWHYANPPVTTSAASSVTPTTSDTTSASPTTDPTAEQIARALQLSLDTIGFDAIIERGPFKKLAAAIYPLIIIDNKGKAIILGRKQGELLLIHDGASTVPMTISTSEFGKDFSGIWIHATLRTETAAEKLSQHLASNSPTNSSTSPSVNPSTPNSEQRQFSLSWFLRALFKYKKEMGQVLLASFFIQVFALMTPLVFQVVIDKVLTHRSYSTLFVMLGALTGFAVFEMVLAGMRHYLFAHTTHRVDVELGAKLFAQLIRLPMSYFNKRHSGDTLARMRELETARHFLTGQGLTAWLDLLFALVFLAVMFYYSPLLTFIVIGFLPIFFGVSYFLGPFLRKKLEDKFALGAENQSFLMETIGAIETLKAQAVEQSWQRRWEQRLARYVVASFESGHAANWTNLATQSASKLLTVVLLGLGALQVLDGHLTVGGLIAFNMLSGRVNAPILKLASLWQELSQMRVSIKRLADIMDATPEANTTPTAAHLASDNTDHNLQSSHASLMHTPLRGEVKFDEVSFRYHEQGTAILSNISFTVQPGEIIGIVGLSGAGKTTLIRLIQHLYTAQHGRILLDGVDVSAMDTQSLRQQIGVVMQDAALFNMSVQDNIALGLPDMHASDSLQTAVIEAASLAGAHDFIQALPQGYQTIIGTRGNLLSGGQRARLAIARALIHQPRILLLDEATASLDYESERVIHDNLEKICAGRTTFIVAHRLATLRLAHRILVLDKGKLVEMGHHAELIMKNGRYRSLFEASRVLSSTDMSYKQNITSFNPAYPTSLVARNESSTQRGERLA